MRKGPAQSKESWKPAIKGKSVDTGLLHRTTAPPSADAQHRARTTVPFSLLHIQLLTLNSMGVYFSFLGVPPPL